jgi:hypothetical protein
MDLTEVKKTKKNVARGGKSTVQIKLKRYIFILYEWIFGL